LSSVRKNPRSLLRCSIKDGIRIENLIIAIFLAGGYPLGRRTDVSLTRDSPARRKWSQLPGIHIEERQRRSYPRCGGHCRQQTSSMVYFLWNGISMARNGQTNDEDSSFRSIHQKVHTHKLTIANREYNKKSGCSKKDRTEISLLGTLRYLNWDKVNLRNEI